MGRLELSCQCESECLGGEVMGEEVLSWWERFHRETESLVVWSRLGPEMEAESIRAALRSAHEAPKRFRIQGDELRRALRM